MRQGQINILSIDGGGYRNIIPLIFLMEFELRSKRNISSMFNMIGGSSFGSIIAACLTYPTLMNERKPKFLTKDILSLWNREVPKIFSNELLIKSNYKGYMWAIQLADEVWNKSTKYDGKNAQAFFENLFRTKGMRKAIRQLMIPGFDIDSDTTIWFDSEQGNYDHIQVPEQLNKEFSANIKIKMNLDDMTFRDAVNSSTATPQYWKARPIETENGRHRFIDGGEGGQYFNNNNPTKSLIIEALRQGYTRDQINVISLGTGTLEWSVDSENESAST